MIGPCPFPCTNKTEFGYCKNTVCLYAPTIRLKSTPRTRADNIRAMTDEELDEALCLIAGGQGPISSADGRDWLDWLKQEESDG